MTTGERFAAYLAGDLDPAERAEVEEALAHDPDLREQIARIQRVDALLADLSAEEPTPEFSARLRAAVGEEVARAGAARVPDEVAQRRTARRRSLAPLAVAAAAAAVIAVVGVGAGFLLRGEAPFLAADDAAEVTDEAAPMAEADVTGYTPEVPVVATGNDYGELELRRLAVNVDTQFIIHPDTEEPDALPLADELTGQLLRREERALTREADGEVVDRCLPELVGEATMPLVPVLVEFARYQEEPAVIFVFVTEEPRSGTYRRNEVWALAPDDCAVLGFAQYDRP